MKRLSGDILVAHCLGAVQVVWLGCIVMLWAWAFDASGEAMLLTLTAMFLAGGTVAAASRPLTRAARWALSQAGLSPGETLSALLDAGGPTEMEGRRLMRLLSAGVVAATAGSLAAMAAVFLSVKLTGVLAERFLWTPTAWAALKLIVQWVGLLPAAAGAMAMFSAAGLVGRAGDAGRTAEALRRWLTVIAAGLAAFAVSWLLGVNVLILAMACAVVMLAIALWLWWRQAEARALPGPVNDNGPAASRRVVAITFAGLSIVLVIQLRLLGEMFGAAIAGRWLWAAASLALLTVMIRRVDRDGGEAGRYEAVGAVIGAVAAVGGQFALAVVSLVDRGLPAFGLLAWVFLQAPLLALVARLISHQRRAWDARSGGQWRYCSAAATGAGLGLAAYLVGGLSPLGWLVPTAAIALSIGAAAVSAVRAAGIDKRTQWIAWGVVLVTATALSAAAPMHELGPARRGMWLSLVVEGAPSGRLWRPRGLLPYARTWRSEGVTAAMVEVMLGADERHARRGRWWVIATSHRDEPNVPGVYPASSVPDPTALPAEARRAFLLLGSEGNYLSAAQIGHGMFDGLLLAPLPADHPDAWRCYNERTIRRCVRRVHPRGVILLRTQVSCDKVADLMAVAETFTRVVGPGWGVAAFGDGLVDLLLAGPREIDGQQVIPRPSDADGIIVFPAERMQDERTHIGPLRVLDPPGPFRGRMLNANRLRYYLQTISGGKDASSEDRPEE